MLGSIKLIIPLVFISSSAYFVYFACFLNHLIKPYLILLIIVLLFSSKIQWLRTKTEQAHLFAYQNCLDVF